MSSDGRCSEAAKTQPPHHDCDGFTVTHKVHIGLPAVSLHNLSRGPRVVHGVGRHQILTVWRPGQAQDVGRPAALRHRRRGDNVQTHRTDSKEMTH